MSTDEKEIEKRRAAAMAAIRAALDANDTEAAVPLFVSHHLNQLRADYWNAQLGTLSPSAEQVVGLLELQSHSGEEDDEGMKTLDFTLPGEVTNYLLTVEFDEYGVIEGIAMES